MELLNFMEDCYAAQDIPQLPFELISKILQERRLLRQIENNKKKFNTVLDFFKQGYINDKPEQRLYLGESYSVDELWENYKRNCDVAHAENCYRNDTLDEEDGLECESFASWMTRSFNINLCGGDPTIEEWYDPRFCDTWTTAAHRVDEDYSGGGPWTHFLGF